MRWCVVLGLIGCGRIGFDAGTDGSADGLPTNANVAFVTSTTHVPGSFGDLTEPDRVCATRAVEGGFTGTFVAFLSRSTIDARDRISSARGWYRPDGLPVGDQAYALTSGSLLHPIRLDEQGRDLIDDYSAYVATGTYMGSANLTCMDYSSTSATVMAG